MSQQTLPGVLRTKAEVHEANNAVIAAAKEAATKHRIVMVIGVAGDTGDRIRPWVFGTDYERHVHDPRILVSAAAMVHGSCLSAFEAIGDAESNRSFEFARKHWRSLFDRGGVDEVDVEAEAHAAVSAMLLEAEERELERILGWLRRHPDFSHQGVLAALEARDHRNAGYGGDERTGAIERRMEILDALHRRSPLPIALMDLAAELGMEPCDRVWTQGDEDLHALMSAGLVRLHHDNDEGGAVRWALADDFEEHLVDGGLRMLAARSVSIGPDRRSGT